MIVYLEFICYGDWRSCIGKACINTNTPQGSRVLDPLRFFAYTGPMNKTVLVDVHSIQLATRPRRLNT